MWLSICPIPVYSFKDLCYDQAHSLCYWPGGMHQDFQNFSQSCVQCQKFVDPVPSYRAPLQPITEATHPLYMISLDIVIMPLTSHGNQYMLVVTDRFTKHIRLPKLKIQLHKTLAATFSTLYHTLLQLRQCSPSNGPSFKSVLL